MPYDQGATTASSHYATRPVTKVPDWHHLIVWDMLFNNITTGLYLVAALCELTQPSRFGPVAVWAYPVALAVLTVDLMLLVLDLGDPLRFHHMLRVFKPDSPMSFGTWSLTAYSFPLTLVVAIDLLAPNWAFFRWVRWLALIAGLLPALGSAAYKGVLVSTGSQPGWADARWLGGYLANSAVVLGCGVMLALASLTGHDRAADVLRPAFGLLLVLNVVPLGLLYADLLPALARVKSHEDLSLAVASSLGVGVLIPLALLFVDGRVGPVLASLAFALIGSYGTRAEIVRLPRMFHEGPHVAA